MEPCFSQSLLGTCVGIVMISCYISGVTCDVPDDVVYTDLRKSVRIGDSVVLTCRFRGTPLAVYWKKGDDPRTAPNLVSWIPTDDVIGLCEGKRPCSIMEMNEDRSLVIKEVSIAEQGRYICRVSSYRGILIHNFTDVNVYAPPSEPYPIIEGCNDSVTLGNNYGCVISTHVGVNITCSASDFFPDLHLFFLHGSEKIAPLEIKKWTNDDGTRSKSVTVTALTHEIPYVCVVSDVPGNLEERAGTVFVSLIQQDDTLMGSTPKPHKPMGSVVIVVPIVFVTIAGVCVLIVCSRRRRRQDRTRRSPEEGLPLLDQMTIKGKLSFYELWMMLSRVTMPDMEKLKDIFYELGIKEIVKWSTPLEAYKDLCQWKTDKVHDDQADILRKALEKCKYGGAWEELWGLRRSSAITVSEVSLKHILWHIGEPGNIDKFLSELIPGRATTNFEITNGMSKLVQEPLRELKKWSVVTIDKNPVVLLSLALEKFGYSPLDRTFFCVPDVSVSPDEVHNFVQKMASRHCSRLENLTLYEIKTIADENNYDLFDTESMISDWISQENDSLGNSSHIEKRCKLDQAAISIGRYDLKGYLVGYGSHITLSDTGEEGLNRHFEEAKSKEGQGNDNLGNDLSDAELRRMVHYLGRAQLSKMFGTHAEADNFKSIKAWMERESSAGQPSDYRQSLRAKLSQIGMEDLIPLEIEEGVCLVELVDIAFRLLMTDIYPLAEALDISADKLKSYRRQFLNKTKLSRGTMGVLLRLGEQTTNARRELCKVLAQEAGFHEMAHLLKYGYELSHGDLCAVGFGVGSRKENCAKISENLGIKTKETFTMNVLRYWRSLMKPPTYNPRTALADAVFPVLGKEKAFDILSGEFRHSNNQKGNVIPFIRDSIEYVQAFNLTRVIGVQRSCSETGELTFKQVLKMWRESLKNKALKENQRGELCRRLDDGGFKTSSSQLLRGEILAEMEKAVIHDVAVNVSEVLDAKVKSVQVTLTIKHVLEEWEEKVRTKPLEQQQRILLSNRLLEEGYKDFSFEVMIGFVPKPLEPNEAANNDDTLFIQSVVLQNLHKLSSAP